MPQAIARAASSAADAIVSMTDNNAVYPFESNGWTKLGEVRFEACQLHTVVEHVPDAVQTGRSAHAHHRTTSVFSGVCQVACHIVSADVSDVVNGFSMCCSAFAATNVLRFAWTACARGVAWQAAPNRGLDAACYHIPYDR